MKQKALRLLLNKKTLKTGKQTKELRYPERSGVSGSFSFFMSNNMDSIGNVAESFIELSIERVLQHSLPDSLGLEKISLDKQK